MAPQGGAPVPVMMIPAPAGKPNHEQTPLILLLASILCCPCLCPCATVYYVIEEQECVLFCWLPVCCVPNALPLSVGMLFAWVTAPYINPVAPLCLWVCCPPISSFRVKPSLEIHA